MTERVRTGLGKKGHGRTGQGRTGQGRTGPVRIGLKTGPIRMGQPRTEELRSGAGAIELVHPIAELKGVRDAHRAGTAVPAAPSDQGPDAREKKRLRATANRNG